MGRVHAYDATDGRRPSRLAVLGVLSGRSAQGGQDRRVPSPWHPHYARDPLGRPGGALERPGRSSDFVQSLVTSYSHCSGRTLAIATGSWIPGTEKLNTSQLEEQHTALWSPRCRRTTAPGTMLCPS